jgi:hypothetical protein
MADIRVSIGPLHGLIDEYLTLLQNATKIELDDGKGGRAPITQDQRDNMLESLTAARKALLEGCQQTVYGLFLTQPD